MPDFGFGEPVAQNVDTSPTKGLQTLSSLMGLQQTQQALQIQRQTLQSGALDIQAKQAQLPATQATSGLTVAKTAQTQAFAKQFASGTDDQGNSLAGPNGEPDPAKVIAMQGRIAPLAPEVGQAIMQAHTAKVGLQSASMALDAGQKATLAGPLQGLTTNPGDPALVKQASDTFDQWAQQHPEMATNVGYAKTLLGHVQALQQQALQQTDPKARAAALQQVARVANALSTTLQGGQAVQTQPQAAAQDVGGAIQAGTNAPPVAGGGFTPTTTTTKGIPPGMATFTDQGGNTWAYNPQDPGHAIRIGLGGKVAPGGAAPAPSVGGEVIPPAVQQERDAAALRIARDELATTPPGPNRDQLVEAIKRMEGGGSPVSSTVGAKPQNLTPSSANTPPTLNVGEAGQVQANTQTVTVNRQQAADAQTQHDILNRIQSLSATPGLYLGPGSKNLADLATAVSALPGMEGAAKYANNYNELVKFMAQNVARQGQSLGLTGSDARLDAAMHANPNADPMDKRTVQNVAQYMGGLVRMGLAKADAMDNWLKQPGNSLQNEHVFEKLWRDNADPRLFQLAEMKDQGSAQDYSKVHIRPSESKDLAAKHDVLVKLGAL